MDFLDIFRGGKPPADRDQDKIIDLSDNTQYPASVLTNLDFVFMLGDDSENFLSFLHGKWTWPSFHWGWDDISHEDAVKSDFLQRAFYSLDIKNKTRRDAMIASEGYRFIWKNKNVEPVPGLITGEELCRYLTRSREWGLTTMKNLNAREEREAKRYNLNPTYDDLMAEQEKNDNERDYDCKDMGCGMLRFKNRSSDSKQLFIVNTALKKAYAISDAQGNLVGFTKADIDWDNVSKLEHNGSAYSLQRRYYFGIGDYTNGIARVNWMLYPDGCYFADSDGFGMEDNDEVNVSAYIDTECRVLVKFQDMEDPAKAKELYQVALKKQSR